MQNKQQNSFLYSNHSTKAGKGFCAALCATVAVTATGILASRFVGRKVKEVPQKTQLQEAMPDQIHESLVRAISHDLRTPLSGILGNSLLYLESHKTLNEAEKLRLVSLIHEDSGWLLNLVENLLAVTRIKDAKKPLNTREEVVEEVVGEALQKMKMRHPDFQVRAIVPDKIIILPIDALLIEQVIINLLENALLHSGSKEPVDVLVEDGKESVTFTVKDYGNGIPGEMLKSMFCATSLTNAANTPHKKIGIGLFICKAIISAHHGTFTAQNHSQGAEFIFTLPKGAINPS